MTSMAVRASPTPSMAATTSLREEARGVWREIFEGDPPPKFSAADEFGTWAAAVLAEKPPVGLSQNGSERTARRKIAGAHSREPATQALTTEVLTTTASFTRHRLTGPDQSCTKPTGWYVAPTGHLAAAYLTLHAPTGHLAAAYLILHTILHTFIHACARGCTRSFTVVCAHSGAPRSVCSSKRTRLGIAAPRPAAAAAALRWRATRLAARANLCRPGQHQIRGRPLLLLRCHLKLGFIGWSIPRKWRLKPRTANR